MPLHLAADPAFFSIYSTHIHASLSTARAPSVVGLRSDQHLILPGLGLSPKPLANPQSESPNMCRKKGTYLHG